MAKAVAADGRSVAYTSLRTRRDHGVPVRARAILQVACALASIVLLVACAPASASAPEPAGPGASMGMGGGASAEGMTTGVIAASANATLSPGASTITSGVLTLERVVAPDDAWVVVRSTTFPGAVLGSAHVGAGETRGLRLELDTLDGVAVRVALHVDRGTRGELEFDPLSPAAARDKPVFADGLPVERRIDIPDYGIEAPANATLLLVSDQKVVDGRIVIRYLIAPGPSWICVRLMQNGVPGRRIALASRPQGEWHDVAVTLDEPAATGPVAVTIYADRGVVGRFENDERDPTGSADRPYTSAGVLVSGRVDLK